MITEKFRVNIIFYQKAALNEWFKDYNVELPVNSKLKGHLQVNFGLVRASIV